MSLKADPLQAEQTVTTGSGTITTVPAGHVTIADDLFSVERTTYTGSDSKRGHHTRLISSAGEVFLTLPVPAVDGSPTGLCRVVSFDTDEPLRCGPVEVQVYDLAGILEPAPY